MDQDSLVRNPEREHVQEFGIDELTADTVGLCFVTGGQMSTALLTHLGEEPFTISCAFLQYIIYEHFMYHFLCISAAFLQHICNISGAF